MTQTFLAQFLWNVGFERDEFVERGIPGSNLVQMFKWLLVKRTKFEGLLKHHNKSGMQQTNNRSDDLVFRGTYLS